MIFCKSSASSPEDWFERPLFRSFATTPPTQSRTTLLARSSGTRRIPGLLHNVLLPCIALLLRMGACTTAPPPITLNTRLFRTPSFASSDVEYIPGRREFCMRHRVDRLGCGWTRMDPVDEERWAGPAPRRSIGSPLNLHAAGRSLTTKPLQFLSQ